MFADFITAVSGTLTEVLDNDTTPRNKFSFNGLGTKEGKFGGVYMMMKKGMELSQDYTVFTTDPQYHIKT